jgi:hypothetical protein
MTYFLIFIFLVVSKIFGDCEYYSIEDENNSCENLINLGDEICVSGFLFFLKVLDYYFQSVLQSVKDYF